MSGGCYTARGETAPGGEARISTLSASIPFDGSRAMGGHLPGPAHLLAAALTACILKNVERFSHLLPFEYTGATAEVELERQDRPPRIVRASYRLVVETGESAQRCRLLHKNIKKFGTISNTLSLACELSGALYARRADGRVEAVEPASTDGA